MSQGAAGRRGVSVLLTVLGLAAGTVLGRFAIRPPEQGAPIVVSTPAPSPTPPFTPTSAPLRVYICGAVQLPAVYELPAGSIVRDALKAAGGPAADADLEGLNLAQELLDQQQVRVPRQGEVNPPPAVSGGASAGETTPRVINLNTGTAAELETLPGIGPSLAQRILNYREANGPFEKTEDIQNVPGIGPATFEGLKDLVTVQ